MRRCWGSTVAQGSLERRAQVPGVQDEGVERNRHHRAAHLPEHGPQPATARERLQDRARKVELENRIARADQQQRRGDVRHQHVLGHVRREQLLRPRVERREEGTDEEQEAGPPVGLLGQRHAVAAPGKHPHRPHVEQAQQREDQRRTSLERHRG
jgi:hypothetical protein